MNGWRVEASNDARITSLAVVAWRLALGWLVGKWFVLLTTATDTDPRRTILPYALAGGNLYVVAGRGAPWTEDVARRPVAEAQAGPGPLAVRARRVDAIERQRVAELFRISAPDLAHTDPETWWALEPTGDRAPDLVVPDLMWMWALPVAAIAVGRLLRRG